VDWNDDGRKDIVAGDTQGAVWFFHNSGTDAGPQLDKGVQIEAKGEPIRGARRIYERVDGKTQLKETIAGSSELADKYSKLHVADWNADGLRDILVGHSKGEFLLYLNTGKKGVPSFGDPATIRPSTGTFPSRPSPYLVDWNGDDKLDLLVGSEQGKVIFFPNIGSARSPKYGAGKPLSAGGTEISAGYRARIDVADWNGDGKLDLLVGDCLSAVDKTTERGRRTIGNIILFLGK
jgi:hypothetical protein